MYAWFTLISSLFIPATVLWIYVKHCNIWNHLKQKHSKIKPPFRKKKSLQYCLINQVKMLALDVGGKHGSSKAIVVVVGTTNCFCLPRSFISHVPLSAWVKQAIHCHPIQRCINSGSQANRLGRISKGLNL